MLYLKKVITNLMTLTGTILQLNQQVKIFFILDKNLNNMYNKIMLYIISAIHCLNIGE